MKVSGFRIICVSVVSLLCCGSAKAQLNPLSVGTVGLADSIVIYYDVTINTGCGCSQISNQGSITGSNFANLLTNDPKTTAVNDPTITLLNLFPLPVSLVEFKGKLRNNVVELSWKAEEINVRTYEIEKSATGSAFISIGTVTAVGNGFNRYSATDHTPFSGANFYRLKIIENDGKEKFSSTIRLSTDVLNKGVAIFPNPASTGAVSMQLNNLSSGYYQLEMFSVTGQRLLTTRLYHAGGSVSQTFQIPPFVTKGLYTVSLHSATETYRQKLLIE